MQNRISPFFLLLLLLLHNTGLSGQVSSQAAPQTANDETAESIQGHPKVALVLAGGSAWGIAHVGVIKVIEELGIPVDIVVGTSMGSIIGGLYAAGYSPDEMEQIIINADWGELFSEDTKPKNDFYPTLKSKGKYAVSINFDRSGFFSDGGFLTGNKILRLVDSYFLNVPNPVDFDELPRQYRAVATDLATGERVVLSEGSLPDAIRASMSLPAIFVPWKLDGRYLVDGGVIDNLPINVAKDMGADIIIAVDLVDTKTFQVDNLGKRPGTSIMRTLDIFVRSNVEPQLANADVLITVDAYEYLQTDFAKVNELSSLGEQTARAQTEELISIKNRITPIKSEKKETYPVWNLTNDTPLVITGAANNDRLFILEEFSSHAGTMTDVELINHIFRKLDDTGRYQTIRIKRDFSLEKYPLVINLTPKPPEKNAFRLGISGNATFSTLFNTVSLDLIPALIINGLTTENSQLLIDAELIDSLSAEIKFIQPMGSRFSVNPFFTAQQRSSVRFTQSYLGYQFNTFFLSTGIDLAFYPFGGVMLSGGWSFDYTDIKDILKSSIFPDDNKSNHFFHANLGIEHLDSPIFPARGISMSVDYLMTIRNLDSARFFQVLKTEGLAAIPIGSPVSLTFRWIGGSDFSFASAENRSPFFYMPFVSSRWLFPGPLLLSEEKGSHAAGAGLEIKYRLNWYNQGITLPIFLLIHGAAGGTLQETDSIDWGDVIHWNASAGLGIRIKDSLGVALRAGVHRGTDKEFSPYVALDIGAIGK
ncbi:patatin-like phospholipase family protein [Treponema sp. OttesenSCG-928-L16]|nr:patatin-like phospholipase family protein [Treponema sp. OttesenSCG-928-L16]